jgi:hypothetical protein
MTAEVPKRRVEALAALLEGPGADLLRQVEASPAPGPADVERWRRRMPAEVVSAAMDLAVARRSLRGRRSDWAGFWADREGAAQASDDMSAAWKAARLSLGEPVVDLCCGCGADLKALGSAAPRARGIDLREDRVWMAARNSGRVTAVGDVTSISIEERVAHIDPARRDEVRGRRLHGWHELVPGPTCILGLAASLKALAVKLGPGIELPAAARPAGSELAFLGRDGGLTQAVLLTGSAAWHAGHNTAVRLDARLEVHGPSTWSVHGGSSTWPAVDRWERFMAEPDPTLERSGLLPQLAVPLGLHERSPGLGLCSRDAPPQGEPAEAWFRWFERIESMPARLPAVARRLRELGTGEVAVKVRGSAVDADAWSAALRGSGTKSMVVLVHRTPQGMEAVLARRVQVLSDRP